jgi:hypothetical protein
MSSPKFELAKKQNPELAGLLDQLMGYIRHQIKAGQNFILPKLAGAKLRMNDSEAYVLLEILAKAGVLQHAFNVYCKKTGVLLATVEREDKLDKIPYCDECDCDHEPQDLRLELAFELPRSSGSQKAA